MIPKYRLVKIDQQKREYEDREGRVIKVESYIDPQPLNYEGRCITTIFNTNNFRLNHDDLLDLSMMLLKQAQQASEYNTNHQNILAKKAKFREFINLGMVEYVIISHIREVDELNTPEGKQDGLRYDYYTIKPIWKKHREPENKEYLDFSYDDILTFPNGEADFNYALDFFGGKDNVRFEGSYIPTTTIPDPRNR